VVEGLAQSVGSEGSEAAQDKMFPQETTRQNAAGPLYKSLETRYTQLVIPVPPSP
jgi:hypothetical protein